MAAIAVYTVSLTAEYATKADRDAAYAFLKTQLTNSLPTRPTLSNSLKSSDKIVESV